MKLLKNCNMWVSKSLLLDVLGHLSFHTLKHLRVAKSKSKQATANPFKIIYVDPSEIVYYGGEFDNKPHQYGERFSLAYFAGSEVKPGNWDQTEKLDKVNQHPKYKAVKKHYQEGCSWKETEIFDYMMCKIREYGEYDGCKNFNDVVKRYNQIDQVYKDISKNGYKMKDPIDQICVNISRDGEFIFNGNGTHRLSIAKILELDLIPVRILVRHQEWQRLRKKIAQTDTAEITNNLHKNKLEHPDLEDILINKI